MVLTPKIKDAILFSTQTHEVDQKQKRKGKDIPYITHPLTVGLLLARAGASEDVIVAGILHDTIEDSIDAKKVTREIVSERFGGNVADLVMSVTEQRKDLPWEERKREALRHIATMNHDSLMVKAADLVSNVSEIMSDYKKDGIVTFDRFNAPRNKVIWHYGEAMRTITRQWPEISFVEDLNALATSLDKIST